MVLHRGFSMTRTRCGSGGRPAFALLDLLTLLALATIVVSLLSVMGTRSRRLGQLGESMANLKFYASGSQSYGADYADRFWSFSWRPNNVPADADPDLRASALGSDTTAAAAQAIQILRRLANRPDIQIVTNWIPHILYSHLVLAEHMNAELPARFAVSPGDRERLRWANDPAGFDRGIYTPNPGTGETAKRWPYSSSYELGPAFSGPDSGQNAITQSNQSNTYIVPSTPNVLGTRLLSEVVHPSQKAMVWEQYSRYHAPRAAFFMYSEARCPILFVDGSVRPRLTQQGNRGWNPAQPTATFPITMTHTTMAWESGASLPTTTVQGNYRYTRQGLRGRDFDGAEVTQ
jgi:hypothetical protein